LSSFADATDDKLKYL